MKKKLLLLAVMITVIISVFAITASAAVTGSTSNEYGEVTQVDGMDSKNNYNDTTSRAVLVNGDGTFTTYPAYYIYNGNTGTNMSIDLGLLNGKTGESYGKSSLIRIEVFENARINRTFEGCSSLVEATLPDSVYFHYASFGGCSSLTEIKIPSAATQIPTSCFDGCINLESIAIPNTVTSIGNRAFANCNKLSEIKIPETYTGDVPHDFRKIDNGKTSTPVTYVVPRNSPGIYSIYSINNCNVKEIIFTGTEDSAFIADLTATLPSWVSNVVYANHCEYYYDNIHNYNGTGDCKDGAICDRCSKQLVGKADHTWYETLVYESFASNGVYNYGCSNESCTKYDIVDREEAPIFKAKGYATNSAKNAIDGGYEVNLDALELYTSINGKLRYGIVIANAGSFTGEFFDSDNNVATQKAVQVEIDDKYSNFNCSINYGANTGANIELIITAYTIDESGNVTFIQAESVYAESQAIGSSTFKKITLQKLIANTPNVAKRDDE